MARAGDMGGVPLGGWEWIVRALEELDIAVVLWRSLIAGNC
jgi:hypothetical protein